MKLFLVFKGIYSDRRIVKIFLNKVEAENFKKNITVPENFRELYGNNDDIDIVEWETSEGYVGIPYIIRRYENKIDGKSRWTVEVDEYINEEFYSLNVFTNYIYKGENVYEFYIMANSIERALKVGNERFGMIKSMENIISIEKDCRYTFPGYEKIKEGN
jgi:hypothetical protein